MGSVVKRIYINLVFCESGWNLRPVQELIAVISFCQKTGYSLLCVRFIQTNPTVSYIIHEKMITDF